MSEERQQPGPINPDDIRQPGAGGGHQPATYLLTNESVDRPGSRSGFEAADTDRNPADEALADEDPHGEMEPETIAERLAYAREHLGDDVFVLEKGSEIFNTGGLRVVTQTPGVVRLSDGTSDPVTNDQRFAAFLHSSDLNWQLNIKQLGRPFDRARCVALPLMCEAHGEDLEYEAYGRPKPCPKCAAEALRAAAEVAPAAQPATEHPNTAEAFASPEPAIVVPPVEVESVVKLRDDETWPAMTVLSIEFGVANCAWFDTLGAKQEKVFGVSVLRHARAGEYDLGSMPRSTQDTLR